MGRRAHRLLAIFVVLLVLAGCDHPAPPPPPSPSSTPTPPRPFTVATTDQVSETDPAAIDDTGSSIVAMNAFQRLLTSDPGTVAPKPDAAQDCIYQSATTLVCTLKQGLTFHNGDQLTSSDVKFSIDRAIRLNVAGSSASLLSSLRRIETPDPLTVRFLLSREDTQFSWALASPAASIVDEQVYNPDDIQGDDEPIVGSGPYMVTEHTDTELRLTRFAKYHGWTPAHIDQIEVRTMPDSGSIEEAMKTHQVDVVWRGLGAAAVTRLTQQIGASADQLTTDGYSQLRLPGVRVHQLEWNPKSQAGAKADVRGVVRDALQEDRTLDSVVPNGIAGHTPSFALGGKPKIDITWSSRIVLSLSYESTSPNSRDLANQIRTRLEDTGGLSVRLRADDAGADLRLLDRKAWTSTAIAWLQPYLDHPPQASQKAVQTAEDDYRATVDETQATALLAHLQASAAADAVLLPVSQSDEVLFVRSGVTVDPASFGPGWQLGLWGMTDE